MTDAAAAAAAAAAAVRNVAVARCKSRFVVVARWRCDCETDAGVFNGPDPSDALRTTSSRSKLFSHRQRSSTDLSRDLLYSLDVNCLPITTPRDNVGKFSFYLIVLI